VESRGEAGWGSGVEAFLKAYVNLDALESEHETVYYLIDTHCIIHQESIQSSPRR